MLRRAVLALAAAATVSATPLGAQTLQDEIQQLFTFGTCGDPLCLEGALGNHAGHFIPAAVSGTERVISFVTNAIGGAIADIPISAASGGVSYRFEGGVPVRTTTSAGPIFAERAQTLGRGRFFLGLNVTGQHFSSMRGVPINNLRFTFTHADTDPVDTLGSPIFENETIAVQVAMDVDLLVTTAFASWGIVDGVDIGVAVPLVHTSLAGSSVAEIQPFGLNTPHRFATDIDGNPVLTAVTRRTCWERELSRVAATASCRCTSAISLPTPTWATSSATTRCRTTACSRSPVSITSWRRGRRSPSTSSPNGRSVTRSSRCRDR